MIDPTTAPRKEMDTLFKSPSTPAECETVCETVERKKAKLKARMKAKVRVKARAKATPTAKFVLIP
jgi:hypothetical protein